MNSSPSHPVAMPAPQPAPQKAVDCWEENQSAKEAARAAGEQSTYIPECTTEGKFELVQCYKVRQMLANNDFLKASFKITHIFQKGLIMPLLIVGNELAKII